MSVSLATRTKATKASQRRNSSATYCFGAKELAYPGRPFVMGIVNVTPDSFSDGGRYFNRQSAVAHALKLVEEGADLLDIGGESTRPGASPVSVDEELSRVLPVISALAKQVRVPISVDTSKAKVARQALAAGACVINDVTALRDADMAGVAADGRATVILMHMQGNPRTMQKQPRYRNVVEDILAFLKCRAQKAREAGVAANRVWIDPGLGFGKTLRHNLLLMRRLQEFVGTRIPVLVGPSRKSFIGEMVSASSAERLFGTLGCVARAFEAGVQMVRVHDVKPSVQLLAMLSAIQEA